MSKPRLHLVGIFHTQHTQAYSHCAFTGKALRFPRMMQQQGYTVIEYSNDGSESEASEHVMMLTKPEFDATYGARGATDFHGNDATLGSPGHQLFEQRLIPAVMLYSLHNQRPAPLPFRIHVNGTTRTDPSTFTAEEIVAAGFTGPHTEPLYDPATHQLDWINGAYVITPIPPPPPQPDWERFKSALLTDPAANAALAAALPAAPGAVMALPAALMAASTGQIRDFRAAWLLLRRQGLVPAQILNAATALAVDCGLPDDFVGFMGGGVSRAFDPSWNPPEDPSRGLEWTAPDGSVWRWDQPRDPATGQFLADDPSTPEIESALDWQPHQP